MNPYTWFTMDSLEDCWQSLMRNVKERDLRIQQETLRQEQNEDLRKAFAAQGIYLHTLGLSVLFFVIYKIKYIYVLLRTISERFYTMYSY